MKRKTLLTVLLSVVLGTGAAMADDPVAQAVEACKPEIEAFCSQVTPGDGRLLACFYAHEDKLSGSCNWALYEASTALDEFVNAIAYLATTCKDDLLEFCGEVQMGEGRVGVCLLEHEDQVTAACKKAIVDTELEMVEE